jgi:hypothetical protein
MLMVAPEMMLFFVFFAAIGLGVAGVYVLPALVAYARGHRNAFPILVLNLLLGWTFIGWGFALIWSLTGNVRSRVIPYGGNQQGRWPDGRWSNSRWTR